MNLVACQLIAVATFLLSPFAVWGASAGVHYDGADGPGNGKHVVLISGDEEYRSEEALPQLAKILSTHHGFECTVLFAVDPETGTINPNHRQSLPGLDVLERADLMVIFTRRRDLPDEQLEYVDRFVRAGKPVVGLRTATHAFMPSKKSRWAHYSDTYRGKMADWEGGFGRVVLGEKWVSHHGQHKHTSTRGVLAPGAANHPILRGIKDREIWASTDVYGVRLPLSDNCQPLVLGEVTLRKGQFDESDRFYGMRPDDGPAASEKLNDPMMPVAWTKTYTVPGGKPGRAFMSTLGASVDLLNEPTRRLIVQGVYWCVELEDHIPREGVPVPLVGAYEPTKFEFRSDEYWQERRMKPEDFQLKSPVN